MIESLFFTYFDGDFGVKDALDVAGCMLVMILLLVKASWRVSWAVGGLVEAEKGLEAARTTAEHHKVLWKGLDLEYKRVKLENAVTQEYLEKKNEELRTILTGAQEELIKREDTVEMQESENENLRQINKEHEQQFSLLQIALKKTEIHIKDAEQDKLDLKRKLAKYEPEDSLLAAYLKASPPVVDYRGLTPGEILKRGDVPVGVVLGEGGMMLGAGTFSINGEVVGRTVGPVEIRKDPFEIIVTQTERYDGVFREIYIGRHCVAEVYNEIPGPRVRLTQWAKELIANADVAAMAKGIISGQDKLIGINCVHKKLSNILEAMGQLVIAARRDKRLRRHDDEKLTLWMRSQLAQACQVYTRAVGGSYCSLVSVDWGGIHTSPVAAWNGQDFGKISDDVSKGWKL